MPTASKTVRKTSGLRAAGSGRATLDFAKKKAEGTGREQKKQLTKRHEGREKKGLRF